MRRIFTTILLSLAFVGAMGQTKDSIWGEKTKIDFGDTKWDMDFNMSFTYNYSLNAPTGISSSGFGWDFEPIMLKWKGWESGALTCGILDIILDWQYLEKGYRFSDVATGSTFQYTDGKGDRLNVFFGLPVGITQQLGGKWGIGLEAVPGIGIHSYHNDYYLGDTRHYDSFYPTKNRVAFNLHLKATVWYDDMGLVFRYQPLKYKDIETTMLSIGIAFRE